MGFTWNYPSTKIPVGGYRLVQTGAEGIVNDDAYAYGKSIYDQGDNIFVHGDNMQAMCALEDFVGKVKLIYIDPPFNTGRKFTHYTDGMSHDQWLDMLWDTVAKLKTFLREDGVMFIHIDEKHAHMLAMYMDKMFCKYNPLTHSVYAPCGNRVSTIIWEKRRYSMGSGRFFSNTHEYLLVYADNYDKLRMNRSKRSAARMAEYSNRDNDPRGNYILDAPDKMMYAGDTNRIYTITSPSGVEFQPRRGRVWIYRKEKMLKYIEDDRIWFGENGDRYPQRKVFLSEAKDGTMTLTIWKEADVGGTREAKLEVKRVGVGVPDEYQEHIIFDTPKPERLMRRIIELGSNPGDWVMDIYGGSGTTAAVAHKLGRKWITVELEERNCAIIETRMKTVVSGNDGLNLSKELKWRGGGGFRMYDVRKDE